VDEPSQKTFQHVPSDLRRQVSRFGKTSWVPAFEGMTAIGGFLECSEKCHFHSAVSSSIFLTHPKQKTGRAHRMSKLKDLREERCARFKVIEQLVDGQLTVGCSRPGSQNPQWKNA
jgi:hypothetical protein